MFLSAICVHFLVLSSVLTFVNTKEEKVVKKVVDFLRGKRPTIPRIVGGQPVNKLEFPWMASLQHKNQHFCGATIISEDWAVTAAHCVDASGPRPFEVVAGAHSLANREPTERRVGHKAILVHEKWNSTQITDDLALILFNTSLDLSAKDQLIRAIDLPEDNGQLYAGMECAATGWGLTSADSTAVSDVPLKVMLGLVSQGECGRSYGQMTKILRSHLCAGGSKGKGICNGDSGGPLNCMINGKWVFVGLDSFTVPCGIRGFPSVFTRVDRYYHWIRHKIAENEKNEKNE